MVATEAQDAPARAADLKAAGEGEGQPTSRRKPPTPKRLQKRKLTLTDAVDKYEATTRAIEGLQIVRKEAAAVLLAHAERTGKRSYKDRIAVVASGGSLILDQAKAKTFLLEVGQRLEDFQTRTKRGWSLKLLK